jgi:hypothetical protein
MTESPIARLCSLIVLIVLCACKAEQARPAAGATLLRQEPADSLVTTSKDGTEIWFTLARTGHAPDGTLCVERGLEIRRGDTRTRVPLLYTGTAPILLDDTSMRAELWNHCRPVDRYLVDLRSGRPVRERSGETR